jgi:hypothetical protein
MRAKSIKRLNVITTVVKLFIALISSDGIPALQLPFLRQRLTSVSINMEDDFSSLLLFQAAGLGDTSQPQPPINGEIFQKLENATKTLGDEKLVREDQLLPEAPPLSYSKFITMQNKRVVVTIRYSANSGLKPYFLTMAKKLKTSHPDIIIERRILPKESGGEPIIFEVIVDGKIVVGKSGRTRKAKVARIESTQSKSIFVSMAEIDIAISRARRKQRPTTVYGDDKPSTT